MIPPPTRFTNQLRGAIFLFQPCGPFTGSRPVVVSVGPAPEGTGRDENAAAYSSGLKLSEGKSVIDFPQRDREGNDSFFASVKKTLHRSHIGFRLCAYTVTVARRGLKEAWSKCASRWTRTGYKA